MLDYTEHDLLAQVAAMYYVEEMTQDAIAAQLGLSRVKIYRLLKQARDEQVIQFTINWPLQRDVQLEERLRQRFGLKNALVLRRGEKDHQHTLQRLGTLGARFLEETLKDGMTLTVCLGRSTYEVIHAIRPGFQAKVNVVQAMGSMSFAMQELDSSALARQLAQKLGGDVTYLASPAVADSVEAANILSRQPDVQRALNAARSAQVALLGIGNLDPATSGFVKGGFVSEQEMLELATSGALGDMGGQVFNAAGQRFDCSLNQRVIGLSLDDMRQIPLTMAVAAGLTKVDAMIGALRTGGVDVLCTDDETAAEVVKR